MTAKEKALELHKDYVEELAMSGMTAETYTREDSDAYQMGLIAGVKLFRQYLLENDLIVFPGYGTDVYKLVWTHKRISAGFLRMQDTMHTTIIDSEYRLRHALNEGGVDIEKRPFTKTDLLKLGVTCFETEEEARAKLEEYKRWVTK